MLTKFLKPKNMRRGLLALLLVAPLVYMFGSLFTALNGAHEGMDISDKSTNTITDVYTVGLEPNKVVSNLGEIVASDNRSLTPEISCNSYTQYRVSSTSINYWYDENHQFLGFKNINANFTYDIPAQCRFMRFSAGITTTSMSITMYVTKLNTNSDYLFGQFFAKDNWVASLGEKAVNNETGIGMPFVGDLISYIDENAMPLSNSAYGYFIWGYSSYILNVLAIYMVVSIAASLVLIPMKVVDSLEERING